MANEVLLQEGHPVDENLRPLKIGGKSSSIELSQHKNGSGARVNGGLNVIGAIKGQTDLKLVGGINCATIVCKTVQSSNIISNGITIDDAGTITLDSATGGFEMKGAGATAKFADMYAGMILGYTAIGIDAAPDSVVPGTSFAITDADHKVTFVAPPSGNIEIEIRISVKSVTARWLVLCLADDVLASPIDFPNSDDATNEHRVGDIQVEGYARVLNHKWVVEGLTAGTEYTWYLSAKTEQAGRVTLWWGGDATDEYEPFIMKATALPATIYTG